MDASAMRTDAELLAAYAATGDEPAFAELARRHGAMVYRVCLRSLGRHHDAEDAAQAVFVILARKARSLSKDVDLAAWLHGTARHAAGWAARSEARRERREEAAAMAGAAEIDPADVGARHAVPLPGDVDAALAALPAEQRQAVILRYLEDRTQEEAAAVAGCPQGTMARRATVGLERLRERLARKRPELGAAALVAALAADAGAAVPASLLPSILAVPKFAAVGAAAGAVGIVGAQHAVPVQIAEGVMKAMFWMKVKLAAAVLAAAAVVGVGTPLVYGAAAGDAPAATAQDNAIRGKVTKVELPERMPVYEVTVDAGREKGVRKGFVFEFRKGEEPLGASGPVSEVGEDWSRMVADFGADGRLKALAVGDLAVTKLTEIGSKPPATPAAAPLAAAEAVNGLCLVLAASAPAGDKLADGWGLGEGQGLMCPKHRGMEADGWPRNCETCRGKISGRTWGKLCNECAAKLKRCAGCALEMPGVAKGYTLRWENVGKEPLVLTRDRCCDLDGRAGRVFLRGPDGKLAEPISHRDKQLRRHAGLQPVRIEAGKADQEAFDPWSWVVKPEAAGEYTLWVEFEQKLQGNDNQRQDMGKGFWTGKVRSSEVKVSVGAKPGVETPGQPETF